jgi:hypothetical protein
VFFIRNIKYFLIQKIMFAFLIAFAKLRKVTASACLPTWPTSAHIGRNFVKRFICCFLLQVVENFV